MMTDLPFKCDIVDYFDFKERLADKCNKAGIFYEGLIVKTDNDAVHLFFQHFVDGKMTHNFSVESDIFSIVKDDFIDGIIAMILKEVKG